MVKGEQDMKKKIGDLTLTEIASICKNCDEHKFQGCPFYSVLIVDCTVDERREQNLDEEIEMEDYE